MNFDMSRRRTDKNRLFTRPIQRALLCGFGIAIMPFGLVSAQPSQPGLSPDNEYSWMMLDGSNREIRYVDQDGLFDRRPTLGRRPQTSSIVTVHELAHHVPGSARRDYEQAVKARRTGDTDKAITYFNKAIVADPEFSAALNDLGTMYLDLDKIDFAIELFNKVIAVDPHAAPPYSNLALVYLRQNQYADAVRSARHAVDLDREEAHGRLILGISLVVQGPFTAEAERNLTSAASQFELAKLWLAVGLLKNGETAKAKDQIMTYLPHADPASGKFARAILEQIESVAKSSR